MASKSTRISFSPSTKTTVIDVRDRYRPQKDKNNDIFDWFKNPQNVYCGRANVYRKKVGTGENVKYLCVPPKENTSCFWKNPYKVGKDGTLQEVLEKFRDLLISEAQTFVHASHHCHHSKKKSKPSLPIPRLFKIPSDLCGKTLGCWCVGEHACHAQILAFAANLCVEMNIRNEDDMRRKILEEDDDNEKNGGKITSTGKFVSKGFIQRLKEVDLMSLDDEYKAKRQLVGNQKKAAKKIGGSKSMVGTSKGTCRKVQSTIMSAVGSTAKGRLAQKLSGKRKR